jgi:hypothetical protein
VFASRISTIASSALITKNLLLYFYAQCTASFVASRRPSSEGTRGDALMHGDNILRFLKEVWGKEVLVSKQDGFFGKPFDVGRGVRCGDISSSSNHLQYSCRRSYQRY